MNLCLMSKNSKKNKKEKMDYGNNLILANGMINKSKNNPPVESIAVLSEMIPSESMTPFDL